MNTTATSVRAPPAAHPLTSGPLVPVAIAWIAVLILLWGTFADMWRVWGTTGTFTHGYAIFPIALFLLWQGRARWMELPLQPNLAGVLLVAAAAAVWLAGALLHLNVVMQFAAVGMLAASVIGIAGLAAFRAAAFALLFMFFAVPAGEELVPWLMDFTAHFTVGALEAVGIPVYSEGRLFSIPTGNFSVEKACSGIRYLIASIVLGTLFAHFYYRSAWRRVLFVALCVVVPVLANGLRAFLIVILAHLSNNEIAVGIDHLIYGWFFFGLVMLLVFWIGRRFAEPPVAPPPAARPPEPAAGPARVASWIALLALLTPIAAGKIAAATLQGRLYAEASAGAPQGRVPAPQAGWTGPITASADWQPRFIAPTRTAAAAYLHGVQPVDVVMYGYERERPGAELVNSENQLFDPERWRWLGEREFPVTLADGRRIPVLEVTVREGLARRAIWRTFVVGERPVQGGMQAKLARARSLLQGGSGAGVALIVSAAVAQPGQAGEPAAPEREVREFLVNYYTPLLACLGEDSLQSAACVTAP